MNHLAIDRALHFAFFHHAGQKRKYTGEDYITHPVAVHNLLAGFLDEVYHPKALEMQQAALLHDVVEDCGVTLYQIQSHFGEYVAKLVEELTDVSKPEHGKRAGRKALDLQHTAKASPEALTIKCCDLAHNIQSIVEHDKAFAKVYLDEKEALLNVLYLASHRSAFEYVIGVYHEARAKCRQT